MRQYSGMGSAEETNRRFRYLLDHGQTGLSVAFDLPTQMGLDSDHPRAEGEVGKTGVAIDSVDDMERLFEGIPLDQVSTSMTINATAPILLLLYELVAEKHGIDPSKLSGTVQNDLLKEYAARGTYIYPPQPSMRLITDLFAYAGERIPRWNTISISGYHMREAGATAAQEIAFTLANGIAYVQAAVDAGLAVDDFAPRLSFFFACHMNFFEEIAKFRAARRMWATIMRERFGAEDPEIAGAPVPHPDRRSDPDGPAAREQHRANGARGDGGRPRGTQSLHTNSFDEALALPTEQAVKIALRTQQVLGYETGVAETVDPLGGSFYVESLTDELERSPRRSSTRSTGWAAPSRRSRPATTRTRSTRPPSGSSGDRDEERVVVGVNRFVDAVEKPMQLQEISAEETARQLERLAGSARGARSSVPWTRHSPTWKTPRAGTDNLLPPMREALRLRATLGEVSDALRRVFGEYRARH